MQCITVTLLIINLNMNNYVFIKNEYVDEFTNLIFVLNREKERGYAGSNSSDDSESENDKQRSKLQSLTIPLDRNRRLLTSSDKYRKTLRLTSEQIVSVLIIKLGIAM